MHFIFPFHVKPKILLFLNFPTGRSEALKARHLDEKRVVLVDHLLVLQLYKQKIENALETMFQSYYISKEFAFKDQKNNNMEMKPSACTKEWIFGLFFPLLLSPSEAYLVLWEKLSSFALEIYRLERMPKKVRNYQQKILDQLKYLSGLPMLYSGKSLEKLLCVAQPVHAGEGKFGRVKFVLNGFIGGNKAKKGCSKPSDISYGGLVSSFGGSGVLEFQIGIYRCFTFCPSEYHGSSRFLNLNLA
ncbi:hypothetical protein MJT46_001328 [Ovis ammon polii x Ovis aries]|nr:hypothetical protein MJT46_001328 [Ovis ammon polii x Ovis aries]